jgi:type II secretory pathway component PulL
MPDLSQDENLDQSTGRSRHRRKKKRGHKKVWRKVIIAALFILACVSAFLFWHLLVQEPAPRTSVPASRSASSLLPTAQKPDFSAAS